VSRKKKRTAAASAPDTDPRYGSQAVKMLIAKVMWDGKKSLASQIVYEAMEQAGRQLKAEPLEALEKAISNVRPVLEVKSRRVGGATYQVPVEVSQRRGLVLAVRWIVGISRSKKGRPMATRMADEFVAAARGEGAAVKKKEETHRMAEANKAFAHYRW